MQDAMRFTMKGKVLRQPILMWARVNRPTYYHRVCARRDMAQLNRVLHTLIQTSASTAYHLAALALAFDLAARHMPTLDMTVD